MSVTRPGFGCDGTSMPPRSVASDDGIDRTIVGIMISVVLFNAILAILNGHATAFSQMAPIACESFIVMATLFVAMLRYREEMYPYIILIGILVLFATIRSIALEQPEPKYVRDVLIIPVFMLLGLATRTPLTIRIVILIHVLVLSVFLLEVAAGDAYSNLFKIQEYYINTRGNKADEFYDTSSELFISASRPGDRFFPFFEGPRTSSVFLEPVSLGNYCSIMVAFACAGWGHLGWKTSVAILISTSALIVGCDGRLAATTSVLLLAIMALTPWMPRGGATLVLPLAIAGAFGLVALAGLREGGDDFGSRIAHTVELLNRFDFSDWLGLSNEFVFTAMDSGVAYLVTTQSVVLAVLVWVTVTLPPANSSATSHRFVYGLATYASLSLLVSYSMLTIKTAALLWFIHGSLTAEHDGHDLPRKG
jgi:putative polymerase